jgi:hypothetical protein
MKTMKVALLATAALAAVSVSARADDTAAIKAQLEALTARIAQLEAAPAAPVGYSLLTISEGPATVVPGLDNLTRAEPGYPDTATVVGIMPTADMPASTTLEWSGFVRAIVAQTDYSYSGSDDQTNVWTRARLRVVGKTDTAVGEVGARMSFEANAERVDEDPSYAAVEYWGWWAMTPEVTFGGGYSGSLGNVGHGYDGSCDPCAGIDWFSAEQRDEDQVTFSANPGDTAQVRLSWASGPISFGVALEDSDYDGGAGDLGGAAKLGYAGDAFSFEIAGIVYEHDDGETLGDDPSTTATTETTFDLSSEDGTGWQVAAGLGFGLSDMAKVSVSAAIGEEPSKGDYWNASGYLGFTLTETVNLQFGASYADYDDLDIQLTEFDVGLYYNPVDQLTLGLEAAWADGYDDFYGEDEEFTTFDAVAIWRF